MSQSILSAFDEQMRGDFALFAELCFRELYPETPYVSGWFVRVLADELWAAASGQGQRLVVNMPPRHLKSLMASIALPAFVLGHTPSAKIIVVTYVQDLSDSLAEQFRQIVRTAWYQRMFPGTRFIGKGTMGEVTTTRGGLRLSTSVGGVLTGRGGDLIIIDDPQKPADAASETIRAKVLQWYGGTLVSRLDSKQTGNIIVVMQRLHEDDLSGFLLAQGGWRSLSLPAIAMTDEVFSYSVGALRLTYTRREGEALHPERESLATLASIRADMGEAAFSAQYLQMPLPPGGGIFKVKWLQYYDALPLKFDRIVESWDCASKDHERADYSACTVWGIVGEQYYLLYVLRERMDYPSLKRDVIRLAEQYNAKEILIEDTSAGTGLIQELTGLGRYKIVPVTPGTREKQVRADQQTAKFEAGQVWLPRDAPWMQDYLHELTGFPNTRHDDQVDSTVQFLEWITSKRKSPMRLAMEHQQKVGVPAIVYPYQGPRWG